MGTFNTDGIVLKQFDLGEADKIITFYTKDKGKVRAVAKNARKVNSRLSGVVLPFSFTNITVYRGRSLDRLNQVKNKFSFSALREDLSKMAYASYMAEMVEKIGMEDDPDPVLFSLLLSSFHKILQSSEENLDYINLIFKLRILGILGLQPELDNCVKCEKKLNIVAKNFFEIAHGGLVCSECFHDEGYHEKTHIITGEGLQIMKRTLNSGFKLPKNLRISENAFKELDELIDLFIVYHLDINIKSQKFLHMIRNLG